MQTLIVYNSKYGAAEKCVQMMRSKLSGEVTEINVRDGQAPPPTNFDRILIGSNIHAGSIHKKVRRYCFTHSNALLEKPTGLFLCCLAPEEKAQDYFEKNFPPALVEQTKTTGVLGGSLYFEKMNFFERFILRKISGTSTSYESLDEERIRKFIQDFEA
jgi:menaquinone-dependent protoporphyrinogen oxidase